MLVVMYGNVHDTAVLHALRRARTSVPWVAESLAECALCGLGYLLLGAWQYASSGTALCSVVACCCNGFTCGAGIGSKGGVFGRCQ